MRTLEQLKAELTSLQTQRQWAIENKHEHTKAVADSQIEAVEAQIEQLQADADAAAKAAAAKVAADKAAAEKAANDKKAADAAAAAAAAKK